MIEHRTGCGRIDTITVSVETIQRIRLAGTGMQMLIPEESPEYLAWEAALEALRKENEK